MKQYLRFFFAIAVFQQAYAVQQSGETPALMRPRTRSQEISLERLCELPLLHPTEVGSLVKFQRKVQDPMLDVLLAKNENVEVTIHSKSSNPARASGDLHRVVKAGKDRLLVFIGDMSGHGNDVSGSLGLAVQSLLADVEGSKVFESLKSPVEILKYLDRRMDQAEMTKRLELINASFGFTKKIKAALKRNSPAKKLSARKIIERMLDEYQVGLGVLDLNLAAGKATYSEGGLFGMLHVKKDGTFTHIKTDNGFVGGFSAPFNLGSFISVGQVEIPVSKGDMLVLASDGFFEAPYTPSSGASTHAPEGWLEGKNQVHWNLHEVIPKAMPADHSPETFAQNLRAFAKSSRDDTTIIVIPIK